MNNRVMRGRLWSIAWPLILANITVPLLGLVDAAVLGHLDDAIYLGAVAIGANIFSFLFWGFGFLRMGTTGLTAQAFGTNDKDQLQQLFARALVLACGIGLLLILVQSPLIHLALYLIDGSVKVSSLAQQYCEIRIFGAPATLAHYVIIGWFIGIQNSRGPLIMLISANGINIGLDLLFVMGFGWQSDGVAWATLIAEYSSVIIGLALINKSHLMDQWRVKLNQLNQFAHYRQLIKVNRHLFVRTISLLFCFAFFTAQGAQQGDLVVATNAVLLTFLLLISNGLDGFANAAEALVGEAIGQRSTSGFSRAVNTAMQWSLATAALFSLFFALAGEGIIRLLSDIPEVITQANQYVLWIVLLPLVAMPSYLFDGIFIGATRTREMQNTMLIAAFGIFIPVWWLSQPLGNHGLWLSLTLFLLFRGASLGYLYQRYSQQGKWLT